MNVETHTYTHFTNQFHSQMLTPKYTHILSHMEGNPNH